MVSLFVTADDGTHRRKQRKLTDEKPTVQAAQHVDEQQPDAERPLAEYSVKRLRDLLTNCGLALSGMNQWRQGRVAQPALYVCSLAALVKPKRIVMNE